MCVCVCVQREGVYTCIPFEVVWVKMHARELLWCVCVCVCVCVCACVHLEGILDGWRCTLMMIVHFIQTFLYPTVSLVFTYLNRCVPWRICVPSCFVGGARHSIVFCRCVCAFVFVSACGCIRVLSVVCMCCS